MVDGSGVSRTASETCCGGSALALEQLQGRQRRTLNAVLWINACLFALAALAGWLAASTALLGDALDMLGDAFVYGFSLYAVARGRLWKARAAALKGWIMLVFGLGVLGQALYKVLVPALPHYPTIGAVGALCLAGNAVCLWLLWQHRAEDINMRSVWLCSRNDIIASTAVIGAGAGVWALESQWPDVLVGVAIAALFLRSAVGVLRESRAEREAVFAGRSAAAAVNR